MKKQLSCFMVTVAFLLAANVHAEEKADCTALKQSIEAKLTSHGVRQYKLDVVDKAQEAEGKIVGNCDGGTRKIVYAKEVAPAVAKK
jgi:hypothetical protein